MCIAGCSTPSCPSGEAGGASACAKPARDKMADAIKKIENSKFAKTAEGKKVVAKIQSLQKDGKIKFKSLGATTRGQWGGGEITVNETYKDDTDAIASELVHEATHALNEDEFPASKTKATIDEEMRTNKNQLDLYEEQRDDGFRDSELERRRKANQDGKLRDDVKSRYPTLPGSL